MSDPEGKAEFTVKNPEGAGGELPRLDFSTFVLSLATSGMVHLGLAPLGEGGVSEPNLPLAQQTIDTLDMLQEKTRGNLGEEEDHLLQSVLYELRMSFVKVKSPGSGTGSTPGSGAS